MKRKFKFCALGLLTILPLVGCNDNSSSTSTVSKLDTKEVETLSSLKKGFFVKGDVKTSVVYYADSSYNVPSTKESLKKDYTFKTYYQNSDSYTGVDRRYYKIVNSEERYLSGENVYNNEGKVALNYVDYNNELQTDGYSSSDGYNEDPYGSSGLVNPFLLVSSSDFYKKEDKIYLSTSKTNVIYSYFLSGLSSFLNMNISFQEAEFSEDFTKVSLTSYTHKGTAYADYTNYYSLTEYIINLEISQIGTASAKDALQPEKEKAENNDLGTALKNMMNKSITISRHSITYDGDSKVDAEETATTYNNGTSIYMQVYDYALNPTAPSEPTASDLYLSPKSSTGKILYAYTLSKKESDGTYKFSQDYTNYTSISGYYYYSSFQPDFTMSQNIFNKNSDGSYSPTEDNLPYIGAECFVPALNTTEEISSGYCSSMKIYLTEDKQYIDHINFVFDEDSYTGYTGEIIVTYSNVGTTNIPFDITIA